MRVKHQRAEHDAEFESDVLQALAEADDPSVPKIAHTAVMAELDAVIAEIQKNPKRKARA
jgi:hypothetical protein